MRDSLQAEIFEGFSLNKLSKEKRLDEMEFYLPLERLDVEALKQILYQHLPQDWQTVRDAVETLKFDEVEGFLKGYIDLIFEHQGKYYIVDYKSNSLDDYAPNSLMSVMASSHYYLQYLLYSVALHRYMQKRLADYSWETHMGGAYYLFIRGMSESETASLQKNREKWGRVLFNGVFNNKPSLELISALDGLFMESFI
jgi:exodeoxyribonuclease V beta subunit